MSAILRLYPRAWRERYGDEIVALLEEHPASPLDHLDLIRGAFDARLHPQVPGTDAALEQEIPVNQRQLGVAAAIGGIAWILSVASMFVLPGVPGGYRDFSLANFGFAAGFALIGIAIGMLGTRPYSGQSRTTGLLVVAISVVMGGLSLMPWPLFSIPLLGFPALAVIAAARGARNGVLPGWIILAFIVGAVGMVAGISLDIESDSGLALFSLVGLAALMLAGSAFTTHAYTSEISPA